jgi:hypothetical protein
VSSAAAWSPSIAAHCRPEQCCVALPDAATNCGKQASGLGWIMRSRRWLATASANYGRFERQAKRLRSFDGDEAAGRRLCSTRNATPLHQAANLVLTAVIARMRGSRSSADSPPRRSSVAAHLEEWRAALSLGGLRPEIGTGSDARNGSGSVDQFRQDWTTRTAFRSGAPTKSPTTRSDILRGTSWESCSG